MGRFSALAAAALLAALGGACRADAETESVAAVTVRTDRVVYAPGQAIVVTVRNGLTRPITATTGRASCTIVSLDRRVAKRWVEVENCFAGVPPVPVRIPAGTTRRVRLPDRLQPGTYRARLEYSVQGRAARATSPWLRVSR